MENGKLEKNDWEFPSPPKKKSCEMINKQTMHLQVNNGISEEESKKPWH